MKINFKFTAREPCGTTFKLRGVITPEGSNSHWIDVVEQAREVMSEQSPRAVLRKIEITLPPKRVRTPRLRASAVKK